MKGSPRLCLRILLWIIGAVIAAVVVMLVIMEIDIERNGGGEMADGLALMVGLMLIAYYTLVLVLGRIILHRGGSTWAWHLMSLMVLLVFVPMILLWRVVS